MKKRRNKIIRRSIIFTLLGIILYLICMIVIPPLIHNERDYDGISNDIYQNERVCLVEDNKEALIWRLKLIDMAQEEIIISTFDFRCDNSGTDIMSSLYNAACRGVKVKIIMDGLIGFVQLNNSKDFKALTCHENIEVKFYNPINLAKFYSINYRLHDKYFIIDNYAYIVGGRNVNDLFLGDYSNKNNFDRDVVVINGSKNDSSLYELKTYASEVWNLDCAKEKKYKGYSNKNLLSHYKEMKNKYNDEIENLNIGNKVFEVEELSLMTGDIINKNKNPYVFDKLIDKLSSAKKNVLIQTPYFICDDYMYDELTKLSSNVEVSMLTNSVSTNDNPWGACDYINEEKKILKMGMNIYQYHGSKSMHTKTILIDDNISIIGSYNADIRSSYLDTEMMICIKSKGFNKLVSKEIDNLKSKSKITSSTGEVSYGDDFTNRKMPWYKSILYFILRMILKLVRYLL